LTVSELANALREVGVTLERAQATTAGAVPLLTEAKAALTAASKTPNGYEPVELDQAMAELDTARDLMAQARQSILDYLMRL
jgi:hypothetical protein